MPDTDKIELGEYEGREIVGTTIAVRNTGDGLSKAMEVAPQLMHHGEMVYVVIECKVVDVQHPFADEAETRVNRKHILKAGNAVTVPGNLVRKALNEMADKIQKARDEETQAIGLDLDYDPLGVAEQVDDAAENTVDRTDEPDDKGTKKPAAKRATGATKKATGRGGSGGGRAKLRGVPS